MMTSGFLKQIGVDYVDIELGMVAGYDETGCFTREALAALVERFAAAGLQIERANARNSQHLDALIGGPGAAQQRDRLCTMAELLAEVGVPVFGVQCFQADNARSGSATGRSWPEGRGGYRYYHFDLAAEEAMQEAPRFTVTSDQLWENLILTYKQLIPRGGAGEHKCCYAWQRPAAAASLWQSPNPLSLCRFRPPLQYSAKPEEYHERFCVGTRYESGEDILAGIRHFGGQGKIVHVHFRNVRGKLSRGRRL